MAKTPKMPETPEMPAALGDVTRPVAGVSVAAQPDFDLIVDDAPDANTFYDEWDLNLLELPRMFRLKASDLGLEAGNVAAQMMAAAEGDKDALAARELSLKIFLELMGRDRAPREVLNRAGKPEFVPDPGPKHPNKAVRMIVKKTMRSRWGIRGIEGVSRALNGESCDPGVWKTRVVNNWDALAPRLLFLDPNEDAPAGHPQVDAWRANHEKSCSDTDITRSKTLALVAEVKAGRLVPWNGLD
jgi:hypothetical protein